jgi:hypothetical protein
MARDSIHSMMSHLPTLPALLEHARNLPPRKGFSPFQAHHCFDRRLPARRQHGLAV